MSEGSVMVCLIKTLPENYWQLPKGMVENKESLEATALREVKEETGLEGVSEGLIDSIEYWFWLQEGDEKQRHHKVVYFYLIKCTGGDWGGTTPEDRAAHCPSIHNANRSPFQHTAR